MDEAKRAIVPFLQRAEEVQKADAKVAYYCRLYAVEEALKIPQRPKEVDALIKSVIDKLEKDKKRLNLDGEEDKLHVEGFAMKIFDNADRVDRAGLADMKTCKGFYAASVFLEVCRQFEEIDGDLEAKQKYAAWKAADIRKALREGRKPTPGSGSEAGSSAAAGLEAGDEVLCVVEEGAPPAVGRVLDASGPTLLVSIPGQGSKQLPASKVARHFETGAGATHRPAGSAAARKVTVVSADASHWPPSYEVRDEGGAVVDVEASSLRADEGPRAAAPPAASPGQASPAAAQEGQKPSDFVIVPGGGASGAESSLPAPPPPAATPAPPVASPVSPIPPVSAPAPPAMQPLRAEHVPSVRAMMDAQKQAKYAVSALGFEDHKTAMQCLEKALFALRSG